MVVKAHKAQPAYDGSPAWDPISEEMQKGLELAAYICGMYGDGDVWAETILNPGEQVRGRWWMEAERQSQKKAVVP